MGASSRSPSPMTTVPRIAIASISWRIDSVATWSECRRSPCPIVRAQATAATSHTRRKSRDSRSTFTAMTSPRARPGSLRLAGVDVHHLAEEVERLAPRPLEGVAADDRGLALLRDARPARVGPDDHGEALALGLVPELADMAVHLVARRRGGVDGEADRAAAQAERIVDAARDGGARVGAAGESVGVV